MNETDRAAAVAQYINELTQQLRSGHAREHAYRPALQRLMSSFDDVNAVNDPARSENGNPDFIFVKDSNRDVILGYAEAKDITVDLDKTLKTEQLRRYAGYEKLFLTNYRDFIFLASGEEYLRISIGKLYGEVFEPDTTQALRLMGELQAFLEKKPEAIRSGRRLAVIMGGKARRIRDNVAEYLGYEGNERNIELEKIYGLMKSSLVHDLTKKQFADLYAQTLVYGLFAARYSDETPDNFDRREAVEAVPKTNPFLRQFFNHIAGADFDVRLRYIVDELCEVFAISDIRALVRHQATKFAVDDEQDLTIHFYEDFLKEYDPVMRQKMGVYYTPVPVVKYIVRSVDRILKEEFGIIKGLASNDSIDHWVETGQDHRIDRRQKAQTGYYKKMPRVQVLDPAVGTATFLNEIIKHIYKDFEGQEGRWPAYVKDNLVKRLHGFELMMAPYTIAHLKLSMTLKETGVKDLNERLGVYLTNTLEEGVPVQGDLFTMFGLAEAVSEESRHAAEIKTHQPIMVVIGNPPYNVSSNNKSSYIQNLIKDYKKNLGERKINLDDDYIKFIRFAEEMVSRNENGVVAMITNNSYIDGITHRQMRKHLLRTFDKIYVLDLHGSTMKKEVAPDGTKDENVFAIMQGVSIVLMLKTGMKNESDLGKAYYGELFGTRKDKFALLNSNNIKFNELSPVEPSYFFVPKDLSLGSEYEKGVGLNELFIKNNSGIKTDRDKLFVDFDKDKLSRRMEQLFSGNIDDKFKTEYRVEDSSSYSLTKVIKSAHFSEEHVKLEEYRPFDYRYIYYDRSVISRPGYAAMAHQRSDNPMLLSTRQLSTFDYQHALVSANLTDICTLSSQTKETGYAFPLYLYHDDGSRTPNFNTEELKKLTINLTDNVTTENIFDYIYAVLHNPRYREKYKEFLKTDFPRVPIPSQAEFDRFVPLGYRLRELHLMKSILLDSYDTTFPERGDNTVETLKYEDGKVWINDAQYFGEVPELAWNLYIGGYQPAQKWLKDRKGRPLSNADLDHYQKIIKILTETDRIINEMN